jgi:predicted regulator of Ras-like GTPase activity (Roadblock/LC7/MglB family)
MKAILTGVMSRLPGALGVAVVGPDGIPVEVSSSSTGIVNMEWAAAEGMDLVRRAGTPAPDGQAGPLEEITIAARDRLTVLRAVGSGYFLCLVTGPGTNPGQARYEAWRTGLQVREMLG